MCDQPSRQREECGSGVDQCVRHFHGSDLIGVEHPFLDSGHVVNVGWQFFPYIVITMAEVAVSITGLEFAYTQAPRRMKSTVMAANNFSVSLGNAFTALVNYLIHHAGPSMRLSGEAYYWFFAKLMFATAVLFIVVARTYRPKTFVQDERPATT